MRCAPRSFALLIPFVLSACSGGAPERSDETPPAAQEAEAAPAVGPLGAWEWVGFQGMDDSTLDVSEPSRYALEIRESGVSVRADCNTGTGSYELDGAQLQFGPLATTMMACPGESLADRYLKYLEYVRSWVVEDGHLYLSLYADGGIMEFRPVDATATE